MRLKQTICRYLPITAWLAEPSPRKGILAGIAAAGLFVSLRAWHTQESQGFHRRSCRPLPYLPY